MAPVPQVSRFQQSERPPWERRASLAGEATGGRTSVAGSARSVRVYSKWLRSAVLISLLLGNPFARAVDDHPLRPTDTSSPRATLQDFVETTDDVYRRMREVLADYSKSDKLYLGHEDQQKQIGAQREAPKIARLLDVSDIAPVLKDTVTFEQPSSVSCSSRRYSIVSTFPPSRIYRTGKR